MDSLEELKSFFTDLAGIWNGGNVAEGLRTKGKKAFETVIKYLPLAGAPGYAAATALEKLPINNIIELLATLIDLISGKVDLKHFLEVLKLFIGDIWELIKTLATEVLPQVWNGLIENVGNPIVDAFSPESKAQRELYNRQQESIRASSSARDTLYEQMKEESIQQFNVRAIDSPEQVILNLFNITCLNGGINQSYFDVTTDLSGTFLKPMECLKEFQGLADDRANDIQEVRNIKTDANYLKFKEIRMLLVPYMLYMRDNQQSFPDYMHDTKNKLPDFDEDVWFNKAAFNVAGSQGGNQDAMVDRSQDQYADMLKPWNDACQEEDTVLACNQALQEKKDLPEFLWVKTSDDRAGDKQQAMIAKINADQQAEQDKQDAQSKLSTDARTQAIFELGLRKDDLLTPEDDKYVNAISDKVNDAKARNDPYAAPYLKPVEETKQEQGWTDSDLAAKLNTAKQSHNLETYMRLAKKADDSGFALTVDPLEPDDYSWPKARKSFFNEADQWIERARREGGGEAVDEYERTSEDLRGDLFGDVEKARADAAKAKEDATKKAAEDAAKAKTDEEARKLALEKDKFQTPYEGFTDRNNGDMTEDEKSKFNDFISQPGNMDYTTGIGYYPPGMRDTVKKRIAAKNAPPAEPVEPNAAATATGAGHPLGWKLGKRYREQQFDHRFFE